jgi:hypothetical protein
LTPQAMTAVDASRQTDSPVPRKTERS